MIHSKKAPFAPAFALALALPLGFAALSFAPEASAQQFVPPPPGGITPYYSVAVSSGLAVYDHDLGGVSYTGPTWGARFGVELYPFLMVEGRYLGGYNSTRDSVVGPGVGLLTTAGAATVRLQLPGARFQPYVFSGVGVYYTAVVGSGTGTQGQPLRSTTNFGLPVGGGMAFVFSRHWSMDMEFAWNGLFGGHFSPDPAFDQAHLWTLDAALRYSF